MSSAACPAAASRAPSTNCAARRCPATAPRRSSKRFGYSDEDAFAVGLTCGGVIDVLVQRIDPTARPEIVRALTAAASGEAAALARITAGPAALLGRALLVRADGSYEGSLGDGERDRTAAGEARAMLAAGRTGTVVIGADGSRCGQPLTLLVESSVPAPRLLVFGAIDFAAALVRAGKFLGYQVTVCDARPVFATRSALPRRRRGRRGVAAPLPRRRGTRRTARRAHGGVRPHPRREVRHPAAGTGVAAAGGVRRRDGLAPHPSPAGRPAAGERADRVSRSGRLHSPIGLDLGARTPEETALSIAAEIVALRYGGSGSSLTGAHTPIHHSLASALA